MAITIQEVRQKYPQYEDLSDKQLVDSLHSKYYSDIPINEFYAQVGLTDVSTKTQEEIDLAKLEKVVQESRPTFLQRAKQGALGALDVPLSFVKGGVRGLTGLAGLGSLGQEGIDYLISKAPKPTQDIIRSSLQTLPGPISTITPKEAGQRFLPTGQQIFEQTQKVPALGLLTTYQPKTDIAKYAETVGEFTFPAMGISAARALKIGTPTGIVQQAQEDIGIEGLAALPLTLATAGLTGYLTDPNRAAKLAREALKGVSDQEIATAIRIEQIAEEQGIRLMAPELINSGILSKLGESVYGTGRGGEIMYNYIKNRPAELQRVAEDLFNEIAKSPESLRQVYKDLDIAATSAMSSARTERTLQSQQAGYKVADNEFLADDQVQDIINQIDDTIAGTSKGKTKNKLEEFRDLFIKEKIKPDEDAVPFVDQFGKTIKPKDIEIPETNVKKISEIYKEHRDSIVKSISGQAQEAEYFTKGQISKFNPILKEIDATLRTNKNYSLGADKYKELTESVVNPTLESIEPFLKGTGVTPEKIKNIIFDPKDVKPKDIASTYNTLNKVDKTAFPKLARVYFENIIDNTLYKEGKMGSPSLKAGFDLYSQLAGTKNAKNNFNAIISGVAEANGLNKNNVLLGFDKFNEILKRTAKIANIDNPQRPPDKIVLPQQAAQIGAFMWQVKFAGRYGQYVQEKATRDLAKIFTMPDSVRQLEKLARIDINKGEALKAVINILAITNNLDQSEPQEQSIPQ